MRTQHIFYGRGPEKITTDRGTEFKNIEYLLPAEKYGSQGVDGYYKPHIDFAAIDNKTMEDSIRTNLLTNLKEDHDDTIAKIARPTQHN